MDFISAVVLVKKTPKDSIFRVVSYSVKATLLVLPLHLFIVVTSHSIPTPLPLSSASCIFYIVNIHCQYILLTLT